jgi:hypothetical protein
VVVPETHGVLNRDVHDIGFRAEGVPIFSLGVVQIGLHG